MTVLAMLSLPDKSLQFPFHVKLASVFEYSWKQV